MMDFYGAAKRLDDIDLPAIGHEIGVGEDEIHALLDVESRGRGFDSSGRPVMLFEPHIFRRQLGPGAKRDRAVELGVAYEKWGERRYPLDSYPRLRTAMGISETAALMSSSFGLGQVMGFNHALAGYDTVQEMVRDFAEDEEHQLRAMVRFIKATGIDDELRRHDWRGFARIYNGPGYERHGYHTRLKERYEWWSEKPDTPWQPAMSGCACPCPASV